MSTGSVSVSTFAPRAQALATSRAAWALFWAGTALCYGFVLLRLAGPVPTRALAVAFVAFHAGLLAAGLTGLAGVHGARRGWLVALCANGAAVGLYWLAVWSVPAFFARFH